MAIVNKYLYAEGLITYIVVEKLEQLIIHLVTSGPTFG